MPSPQKSARTTLLAKIDVTYGTDPVPTGGSNAIIASNVQVVPLRVEFIPRDVVRPYLGNVQQLVAAKWKTIEFDTEIAGSGDVDTAPPWGVLARMCGMGETITADTSVAYKFISTAEESGTIYVNLDGILHKAVSCRGTWSLRMTARQRPVMHWTFTGLFATITDASLPSCTWTAWQKPVVVNDANSSGFQLHSYAAKLAELTLDAAVQLNQRDLVGVQDVQIVDRKVVGSVLIEHPTIAQKSYYANIAAETVGNLALTHGTVAGNIFTVGSSTIQLGEPALDDQGGNRMLRIPLFVIPSETGNDELTLTTT